MADLLFDAVQRPPGSEEIAALPALLDLESSLLPKMDAAAIPLPDPRASPPPPPSPSLPSEDPSVSVKGGAPIEHWLPATVLGVCLLLALAVFGITRLGSSMSVRYFV